MPLGKLIFFSGPTLGHVGQMVGAALVHFQAFVSHGRSWSSLGQALETADQLHPSRCTLGFKGKCCLSGCLCLTVFYRWIMNQWKRGRPPLELNGITHKP